MVHQCVRAKVPTRPEPPPPENETATPVASRGGGAKQNNDVNTEAYTPVSLLDKWRWQGAISADPKLPAGAKVVAGVLLDCLSRKTGKWCPLDALARLKNVVGYGQAWTAGRPPHRAGR
jgi:hypothetical protein